MLTMDGALCDDGSQGVCLAPGDEAGDVGGDEYRVCSCERSDADLQAETVGIYRDLVDAFREVLAEVESAYSDEMSQAPKPHREQIRVELAASLQTLQAVLNLSGLRMAERLASSTTA